MKDRARYDDSTGVTTVTTTIHTERPTGARKGLRRGVTGPGKDPRGNARKTAPDTVNHAMHGQERSKGIIRRSVRDRWINANMQKLQPVSPETGTRPIATKSHAHRWGGSRDLKVP